MLVIQYLLIIVNTVDRMKQRYFYYLAYFLLLMYWEIEDEVI